MGLYSVIIQGDQHNEQTREQEARHQNSSTIYCSQFRPGGWHEKIGQETLADAILERIIHDSYHIFSSMEKCQLENGMALTRIKKTKSRESND